MSKDNTRSFSLWNLTKPKALVTILVAVGSLVGFHRPISEAVGKFVNQTAEAPLDQEVDNIKSMIGDLLPDIREQMIRVAKAESKSKRSDEAIGLRQDELFDCQQELKRIHLAAKSEETTSVKIGERIATNAEIRTELGRLLNVAQLLEDTLRVERESAASDRSIFRQEQRELKRLVNKKQEMEVQVANFRARLASVNSHQTGPPNRKENKLVDQCREKVDDVAARLEVAEKLLAMQGQFTIQVPPRQPLEVRSKDVMKDVEQYFSSHQLVSSVESNAGF